MPDAILDVLLVEDDPTNVANWDDAVATHNADSEKHGFFVASESARSVEGAIAMLASQKFDAVVVDLRLHGETGALDQNSNGNTLIKHIVESIPVGVVIYTGQPSDAEVGDFRQVEVMDRGDGLDQIFAWLSSNRSLFHGLREVKAAFDRETAKIFFRSIWPRWAHWTSAANGPELIGMVSRHVLAHAHDALMHAGGEQAHPEESYFVPPLRPRLDTGDLLELEGQVLVVLTPRCDLAHDGNTETILCAPCVDISADWDPLIHNESANAATKRKKLRNHNSSPKRHFLPRMRDSDGADKGPWMVNFSAIRSFAAADAFRELTPKRFASLAPQFVPSLVERFGAYFSRIGTPDLT
jgi:CheY-like chemotaxis protein